eukprot:4974164-Pyramimonas_sp.AAC.1
MSGSAKGNAKLGEVGTGGSGGENVVCGVGDDKGDGCVPSDSSAPRGGSGVVQGKGPSSHIGERPGPDALGKFVEA